MSLSLRHDDLLNMYIAAAFDERKLPFRVRFSPFGGTFTVPTRTVTFWNEGWAISFTVVGGRDRIANLLTLKRDQLTITGDVYLHGDRQKFEEDFVLAKCSLP